MTITVGRCLKRKTMLVWVKEHIIKNFATCKTFCNLQELYTAFKEKHPNVKIGFLKFCALTLKRCVPTGSKITPPVCVCSAHQNVVWLVDAMDWDFPHIKKRKSNRDKPCKLIEWINQQLVRFNRVLTVEINKKVLKTLSVRKPLFIEC